MIQFSFAKRQHLSVYHVTYKFAFHITVIYAFNNVEGRQSLWRDLQSLSDQIDGPWMIDCPLNYDDRVGSPVTFADIKDFKYTAGCCNVFDLVSAGPRYTWNNKQIGSKRVMSKLG